MVSLVAGVPCLTPPASVVPLVAGLPLTLAASVVPLVAGLPLTLAASVVPLVAGVPWNCPKGASEVPFPKVFKMGLKP